MRLLIIFIAVPLIEIGLFIQVGDSIGVWPTLLIVLITAFTGTWLVRSQGTQTLVAIQDSVKNMSNPSEPLAHGAMILFAGALLLTPGFFTDAVGFLLLFRPVRKSLVNIIWKRLKENNFNFSPEQTHQPQDSDVLNGTFEELPSDDGLSKWTKD